MKYEWIKTKMVGVRYREHPTRKHGIRRDRYYTIRYKLDGKDKEEALGWESEGWTETRAAAQLYQLKENRRTGNGEITLADKRNTAQEKIKREKEAQAKKEKESILFSSVFERFIEQSRQDKAAGSWKTELGLYKAWLFPLIGSLPMKDISPFILEKLKRRMHEAGKAPRTIAYALAVVRQIYNYAKNHDLFVGENPTTKVKKPSEDNRRSRFLSHEEAALLLRELKTVSTSMHDVSLLSLHCGLRAGEIFKLTWNDIDFSNGIILIKDTKTGRNRNAIMTADIKSMFERRRIQKVSDVVFSSRTGKRMFEVSNTFDRTVERLNFNRGIIDRRQKVVFHTLRHTFASWLVLSGVDLYTVQKLMGHSSMAMTERYSHLAPGHLKKAINMLEININQHKENNLVHFSVIKQ
jgi:integrase